MQEFFIPLNGNLTLGQVNQNKVIRPIHKFRTEPGPKTGRPVNGEGSYSFIFR